VKTIFNNPFEFSGRWFRGNLHTHTTNSDGKLSPKQIIYLYRSNGYDFIAITDHWIFYRGENADLNNFLVIPGEEINLGKMYLGASIHIVALNIFREISDKTLTPQQVIDEINSQNGLAIIAHPYWSSLTLEDLLRLKNYIGIEVYNTTCDVINDKGYSYIHWDLLLDAGRYVYGFAVDDSHWSFSPINEPDVLKGWIMVKASGLELNSIINSIKNGLFYSTCGPEIKNVEIESNKIYVETSPVKYISFMGSKNRSRRIMSLRGEEITSAEYSIRGSEKYIRIQCIDSNGKMAWTNPIIIQGE